jgi:hypothetical protein
MDFFLNQVADVGTRITWSDKRFRRFLFEVRDLMDFKGEINNSWGMYSLYIHSNGRTIKEFVERLVQYAINVDSADRNIIIFPNPFQYNITFNGDKYSNQPVIQKKFKDIKYLKLETISLPDQYSIKKEVLNIDQNYNTIKNYFDIHYSQIQLNTKKFFLNTDNWNPSIVYNKDDIVISTIDQKYYIAKNNIPINTHYKGIFIENYRYTINDIIIPTPDYGYTENEVLRCIFPINQTGINIYHKVPNAYIGSPASSAYIQYYEILSNNPYDPAIDTINWETNINNENDQIRIVSKYIEWSITFTLNNLRYTFTQDGYNINTNNLLTLDDYNTINQYLINNYSILNNNQVITIPNTSLILTINLVNIYWIINYIINGDSSIVYEIDNKGSYNKYYIDTKKKISNDRFFYVYIPEIKSQNYTTSSDNVTFIVNCTGTNDYTLLNNIYPTFMFYKDAKLENANKYTVKITDRYGKVYAVNNLDYNANLNDCNCQNEIDYATRIS